MRVAVLADIHGNLPALAAVLESVEAEGLVRTGIGRGIFVVPLR